MNAKLFANILAASAIALGYFTTIIHPTYAQVNTYFCGVNRDGVPTTYARNALGRKIPLISWQRNWNNKFSQRARCEAVSARFQTASVDGVLNYLTTGTMNGQKVLCAASRYGGTCNYLLLTLRASDDASQVIENLRQMGYTASGPIVQSDDESHQTYIDMNQLLREERSDAE
ncbi:hypothetical protein DP113_15870 [Brasilonema octagenarum UFV-E1]|uniref:Uncharacterized protein n=1 Tax=Brasilonema sennae CENA114 TaxID=415709 RepID=A0A856MG27_9CYAN|nr:COP23 domain-containing protein [Brasilonema sennae]QDL09190.1 hypothetical protein DP114_15935 [Brasilonema sennae CENA114]QDL15548.1 hypothetical protein DP113_15870 [Brasilonema octagenarum UFV-E1]